MIDVRTFDSLGHADHGWLDARHHFSFAGYHDPKRMGWGRIRVWNDDRIAAKSGFPPHPHRDMEIVTYVLEGALGHKDSMGNGSTIVPGDVQRMSAGSGVRHSEYNHEKQGVTHFLQIWIEPDVTAIPPSYEQKHFKPEDKRGRLRLIASPDGRDGSVKIHQAALVYAGLFNGRENASHDLKNERGYVHVARGRITVNGHVLDAGDALKTQDGVIELENGENAEVLLFDLP
jgi:quercetin 2,3-dioxygenase